MAPVPLNNLYSRGFAEGEYHFPVEVNRFDLLFRNQFLQLRVTVPANEQDGSAVWTSEEPSWEAVMFGQLLVAPASWTFAIVVFHYGFSV
jgi:hypothetical protein